LLLLLLLQLPLYQPSPEEQADPRLYAANVRDYMLRHSTAVMGAAALKPSAGGLRRGCMVVVVVVVRGGGWVCMLPHSTATMIGASLKPSAGGLAACLDICTFGKAQLLYVGQSWVVCSHTHPPRFLPPADLFLNQYVQGVLDTSNQPTCTPAIAAAAAAAGLLEDKRRYQAWLRSRQSEVEAGQGLTPAIFKTQSSSKDAGGNHNSSRGSTKKGS
jgi:hypothetical protein